MAHTLVLLRHGQSEWNAKNLFTGWRDPGLTPLGFDEAAAAGHALKEHGLVFDRGYVSDLKRAQDTMTVALQALGQTDMPITMKGALRERDYGDLSGLNKDEARTKFGEEQVHIWRRSYDTRPPGGESLRDTVARVVPYYCQAILPGVLRGERTLVAAHGNSLRALVMVLDGLDPSEIVRVEIATGVPIVYELNPDATVKSKVVLDTDTEHHGPDA